MLFMMLLYAIVLVALAAYLFTHRTHDFLMLKDVPRSVSISLASYAVVLVIVAIAAIVSAFIDLTWLKLAVLVAGALIVGLLGVSLPGYMNRKL
ncbi:hypothetical protein [Lacticaseibacillus sp. GG6-2]